jgi:hypothetical protein
MSTPNATLAITAATPVPQVLAELDAKLKSLEHISDSKYRTIGNLGPFGDIKTQTKIEELIKAHSYVTKKAACYDESMMILKVESCKPFEENGYSADDWVSDIKLRIDILQHKETMDKLQEAKSILSQFLSAEDQKAIAFAKVAELLGKK